MSGCDIWDQESVPPAWSHDAEPVVQRCSEPFDLHRPYVAGTAVLHSLIQQLEDPSKVFDNYLLSSVAVWCACAVAVLTDADDELLADHSDSLPKNDYNPSLSRLCHRLRYRLESCLHRPLRGNEPGAVPDKQPVNKFGANTVSQGSNHEPLRSDAAASVLDLSTPYDISTGVPDDETDSEAAVQQPAPSSASLGGNMALSSEAIVQWMRGCTPNSSEYHGGTSTELATSTTTSSIQGSTSLSALSFAASFRSLGGDRAQVLLDKSIGALTSLSHAMELSEYVMLVQLAGASGVCRALMKSLASLASKIPTTKLSIQVVCMPGLHGVSRMLIGMDVLPSLAPNKRDCPWSTLFKSSRVPRATLFASSSGKAVCEDAVVEVQKQDAAQTFPWTRTPWPNFLHNEILQHDLGAFSGGSFSRDNLLAQPVLLIYIQEEIELPLGFAELLAMWIAMYAPTGTLCCYIGPDVHQLRKSGSLLFLHNKKLSRLDETRQGQTCCMLFSPVYRHLWMVVDLEALSAESPAWSIPDSSLQNVVHDLDYFVFKRLHATHALIMVSMCEGEDVQLRSILTEAVRSFYSLDQPGLKSQVGGDIEPIMYCFTSYYSPCTPTVVKDFLQDASSYSFQPETLCTILSVSVPKMTVSEITCWQLPKVSFVRGFIESHFQGDLMIHPLLRKRPLFS